MENFILESIFIVLWCVCVCACGGGRGMYMQLQMSSEIWGIMSPELQ